MRCQHQHDSLRSRLFPHSAVLCSVVPPDQLATPKSRGLPLHPRPHCSTPRTLVSPQKTASPANISRVGRGPLRRAVTTADGASARLQLRSRRPRNVPRTIVLEMLDYAVPTWRRGHRSSAVRGSRDSMLGECRSTEPDGCECMRSCGARVTDASPQRNHLPSVLRRDALQPAMDFRVDLEIFRGPLDLLLYLVRSTRSKSSTSRSPV